MPITALPAPPLPTDTPADFNTKAFALLGALPTFVTEANALETAVDADATTATTQANSAATSANTATTQANSAATSANTASTKATEASNSAAAAETSRIEASKLNLGSKTTAPTLDNQGEALLAGSTYYDTTLNKWRVWTGAGWGDGISAIAGVASVNGMTGNVTLPLTQTVAYDNRANLRSQSPINGEMAVIDGLGLFFFATGSDEPDDDESCFATATGRWLLQAVHWDVVNAWRLPDDEARDAYDEDEPLRFASKVFTGSATCAITTVAAASSAAFTGSVTGAAVGDRVIATPPAEMGASNADTARLCYHAWVSATDTVTIMLTNASAATATTNIAIRTAWPITIIKS